MRRQSLNRWALAWNESVIPCRLCEQSEPDIWHAEGVIRWVEKVVMKDRPITQTVLSGFLLLYDYLCSRNKIQFFNEKPESKRKLINFVVLGQNPLSLFGMWGIADKMISYFIQVYFCFYWRVKVRNERNYPCGWKWFAFVPVDENNFQTAFACVWQAHDLLSAFYTDVVWYSRHSGYFNAAGYAQHWDIIWRW